jgi:hypothetical protein
MLLNTKNADELVLAAVALRREAAKISGWREKAIMELICDGEELRPDVLDGSARTRIINALALRDDQFQTDYFKILLRRQHLFQLFVLLLTAIGISLLLSSCGVLPPPFDNVGLIIGVVIFGALGAALSVGRGLLATDVSARIPAQKIGSFVIWMRPAIGAAAALISFVLLNAEAFKLFDWDSTSPNVIFMVAIAAGFSERFIVGAIDRIAEGNDKTDEPKKKDKGKDKGKDERPKDRKKEDGKG